MGEVHIIHVVGIVFGGVLVPTLTFVFMMYRWKQQDKANIIKEAQRQKEVEMQIANNTSYIKRVEREYKEQDKRFNESLKELTTKVMNKFDDLTNKVNEIASELRAHRERCEGRKES